MRVLLISILILSLALGSFGLFLYLSVNQVLAEEPLPIDFLKAGDSFRLIVDINDIGVRSVTHHYEYAD